MIPKLKPYLGTCEIKSLFDLNKDARSEFEEKFARTVKGKFAVSFPYGRSALYALLKSQNVLGSTVLIPAYTCIVVLNAITWSGNTPSFADISLNDYNMDLSKVETKISRKTKAIVLTHMYGYPMNVVELKDMVGEDVLLIEDAALAFLSKGVGTFGDATFYSFNIAKQLTTFDGSVVVTNNDEIYEKLKKFRASNFKAPSFRTIIKKYLMLLLSYLIFDYSIYTHVHYFWQHFDVIKKWTKNWDLWEGNMPKNFTEAYTSVQAKIGLAQLEKAKEIIEKRVKISKMYDRLLGDMENIILPPIRDGSTYSHYTIRVKKRNIFIKRMENAGIEVGTNFDYSIPFTPLCRKYRTKEDFPNSVVAANEVVNLPNYPSLERNKVEYIAECVRSSILES